MFCSSVLKAWWAIISKVVKWRPLRPTDSRSFKRMQGWEIVNGFAGGLEEPLVTWGWKTAMDAIERYMSFRQRATTDARGTLVWLCFSKKLRNASRASSRFIGLENNGLPMKEYSTQGASPQSSRSTVDQKKLSHFAHFCRVKPESWKKRRERPSLTRWQRVGA